MCVRACVRPRSRRRATFLQKKNGRATLPEISKRWVEMSKSLSRDLRRRPTATEPSQAESQSQARPGQAEPIAPSSFTQLPQAPPICISGLRPGLCGTFLFKYISIFWSFGIRSGSVWINFRPISDQNFRSQKFLISKVFNLCGRRRCGGRGPLAAVPSPAAQRAPAAAATAAQIENFCESFWQKLLLAETIPKCH